MNLSTIKLVEVGDTQWKLLVSCSHRGAEFQECSGIARAWITDPKMYVPQYTNVPIMMFMLKGTVVATEIVLLKFGVFLDNTYPILLAEQMSIFGMTTRFGKLSTKKHHQLF